MSLVPGAQFFFFDLLLLPDDRARPEDDERELFELRDGADRILRGLLREPMLLRCLEDGLLREPMLLLCLDDGLLRIVRDLPDFADGRLREGALGEVLLVRPSKKVRPLTVRLELLRF